MSNGRPDIAPLERAIERLQEGLAEHQAAVTDIEIRKHLIWRFEDTYGLAWQTLRGYLVYASSADQIDRGGCERLISIAHDWGLLRVDWPQWREYRRMVGKTGQIDDEKIALELVAEIPQFLEEFVYLRDRLRRRLA